MSTPTHTTTTHADKLKAEVLSHAWELLNRYEEDITSGIEEGIYLKEDNVENAAKHCRRERGIPQVRGV